MRSSPSSRLRPLSPLLLSLALGCSSAPEDLESPESLAAAAQPLKAFSGALPPGLEPSLVKDIQVGGDPTRTSFQKGSWKSQPTPVATSTAVYFTAQDESTGVEFWRTDGTPEGTRLIRDIRPGPDAYVYRELAVAGDTVYLVVSEPTGDTLWKSDGTPEGTVQVRTAQGATLRANDLVACNGQVFFHTDDGTRSRFWKSDGTPEGTVLLTTSLTYNYRTPSYQPAQRICAEGTVFFMGTAGNYTTELWKSNGTVSGTVRLQSVGYLGFGASSNYFAAVGSRVFFNTFSYSGNPLWTSDGTPEGTRPLPNIPRAPSAMAAVGGRLFFTLFNWGTGTALWSSDGTAEGTRKYLDMGLAYPPANPLTLSVAGDTVLLGDTGRLYTSDGTAEGTAFLKNLNLVSSNLYSPQSAVLPDGRLLFSAYEISGARPWVSDGTGSGTVELRGAEGQRLLAPGNITRLGDRVLLWADDGVHGAEPWVTDGTPEGTRLVRDIFRDDSARPLGLTDVEGTLFFTAFDAAHGRELWKTDGTAEGTVLVKELGTLSHHQPLKLTRVGSSLFFFTEFSGLSLWKSDGTEAGTVLLRELGRNLYSYQTRTAVVGSTFFFTTSTPTLGTELWKSDGTAKGTELVVDLTPGTRSTFPLTEWYNPRASLLYGTKSGLYFAANDGVHGLEPWTSDGTARGTVLLRDVVPGLAGSVAELAGFVPVGPQGGVAFTASNGVNGLELWMTDGTPAGTRQVADVAEGAMSASPQLLTVSGPRLFFVADEGVHGRELWSVKQAAFKSR